MFPSSKVGSVSHSLWGYSHGSRNDENNTNSECSTCRSGMHLLHTLTNHHAYTQSTGSRSTVLLLGKQTQYAAVSVSITKRSFWQFKSIGFSSEPFHYKYHTLVLHKNQIGFSILYQYTAALRRRYRTCRSKRFLSLRRRRHRRRRTRKRRRIAAHGLLFDDMLLLLTGVISIYELEQRNTKI